MSNSSRRRRSGPNCCARSRGALAALLLIIAAGSTSGTSAGLVDGTASPYTLTDLRAAESTIDITSANGAFFSLPAPTVGANTSAYVTLSACSGPEIYPPANSRHRSAFDRTYLRLVVSTNSSNAQPQPGSEDASVSLARGGFAAKVLDPGDALDGLWIGVFPPKDPHGLTGNLTFEVTASYNAPPLGYTYAGSYDTGSKDNVYVLGLDDTDYAGAILSAAPQEVLSGAPPKAGIIFSETQRAPSSYFNSSACAIRNAFYAFLDSVPDARRTDIVQLNLTSRGLPANAGAQRTQFKITGLQAGTNYTAWLTSDPTFPPSSPNFFYGPAVKFMTKRNTNCRLVSDVSFCPDVAYATAIGPSMTTAAALSSINETVSPTLANFTKTLHTFNCDNTDFGMYSYIATCDDCQAAYQRWLCAVAIPRCVDTPTDAATQSAASQNGSDLTGASTGVNAQLLPYVATREASSPTRLNTSVGTFHGAWGELLPCMGVCNMVEIMCPPLMHWLCPLWDITAQRDYGTWADANAAGFGQGDNGGAGANGERWGGVQRYIATDSFGNQYCNPLGVDLVLRQNNRAARTSGVHSSLAMVAGMPALAAALCIAIL
ncbi:hypothetical protein K437DRAFT_255728 [Tilletiaria anomala UBC 951]|uniref:FZ domain-containing protein n=1 Tax=Tilletiaria anomala (strain ATCC 24038 / CBS 436.72 / UBC 951) TaxID=1037660 RepID=A0A066W211_TILAU|nr:uncharacterized protein K437DRAFT_255728 [Tilletiaria anomala UBC 951]KDN47997.1 hypothetical protein K437DRAFT_255728 [Tilletiaria anomala UBC 951]